jgi:hypothetical protein
MLVWQLHHLNNQKFYRAATKKNSQGVHHFTTDNTQDTLPTELTFFFGVVSKHTMWSKSFWSCIKIFITLQLELRKENKKLSFENSNSTSKGLWLHRKEKRYEFLALKCTV